MLKAWLKRLRATWISWSASEEDEFWRAHDEYGGADYDRETGERYEPEWDAETEEWVYRDRRVKGHYVERD